MFIGGALLAFAAVVFGFYLRTRQNPYNPFESELFGEILPGTPFFLQPLIPIYLAITTNFLALQGVVGHYPDGGSVWRWRLRCDRSQHRLPRGPQRL